MRLLVLSFLLLGTMAQIRAQDKVLNEQIWIDFYPRQFVSEKFEYAGDAGFRAILEDFSWVRLYARPSIRYHYSKKVQFRGGLGFFYLFNKEISNRFEITPWQGVQVKWPEYPSWHLEHLFRFEERFSWLTENSNYTFSLRFRYRLMAKFTIGSSSNPWVIPVYGELFFPVNDNIEEFFRNRERVGLGVEKMVPNNWTVGFMFNWQGSRGGEMEDINFSDLAFQLKLIKRWPDVKKEKPGN